jgi:sterol desaturase/sphingolipid hydroxylase (fatty acid hydroxylase superfamily)
VPLIDPARLPPLVVIAIGVLGADFVRYWVHRLDHTLTPLWRLHALHHADDRPDVTTSFRHHPVEHLMLSASVWVAHGVLGASAEAMVIYGIITAVMSPLQHANLRFPARLERMAEWLFVTNALHLSHHSTDPREGGANFGIMFSIWDRVFGTYRAVDPARAATMRYGLDEVPASRCDRLDAMVLLPIRYRAR